MNTFAPDDYDFPEWLPETVRHKIRGFHKWHHGQKSWAACAQGPYNGHPPLGSMVDSGSLTNSGLPRLRGRWVPLWNNIGCVVMEDGTHRGSSTCDIRILETTDQ